MNRPLQLYLAKTPHVLEGHYTDVTNYHLRRSKQSSTLLAAGRKVMKLGRASEAAKASIKPNEGNAPSEGNFLRH